MPLAIRGIHRMLNGHKNIRANPANISNRPKTSKRNPPISAVMYEYRPFSIIRIPKKNIILCGIDSKNANDIPASISITPKRIKNTT